MSIHKVDHVIYELNCVKRFMETVGQDIQEEYYPDKQVVDFRKSLINEEVGELDIAVKTKNNVEIVDALMDILYVAYGAILSLGVVKDYINLVNNVDYKAKPITTDLNVIIKTVYHLCDMQGIDRRRCFDIVHSSNMSKFDTSEANAVESVEYYKLLAIEQGASAKYTSPSYKFHNGLYIIFNNEGGKKILKSTRYLKVDFEDNFNQIEYKSEFYNTVLDLVNYVNYMNTVDYV
jgi:hypothetical protein